MRTKEILEILLADKLKLTGKPSKLTHLLQLYYEKGCKHLTKPQVEKLATDKKISKKVLVNRWNDLKADNYQHNGNVNNVKEFIRSYQLLMQAFNDGNYKAFQDVKNHYDQLKETYPDLTY
jgi:agmatine/peptidylarginine deiminase